VVVQHGVVGLGFHVQSQCWKMIYVYDVTHN